MYFAINLLQFSGAFLVRWWNYLLLFALHLSQGSLTCLGISHFPRQQTAIERTRSYLINYDSLFLTRHYKQVVLKNCALSYPHQAESGLPYCKTRYLEATVPQEMILMLAFAGLMSDSCIPQISCLLWYWVFSANPQSGTVFLCLFISPTHLILNFIWRPLFPFTEALLPC